MAKKPSQMKRTGKATTKKKVAKMSTPLDKARKAAGKLGGGSGMAARAIDKKRAQLKKALKELG